MNAVLSSAIRILYFIIAFGLLVFLHELGHYLMAKLFHIEVEEFGFGFPPRLVKLFQFQETVFTLNWIPFGAFVRPKGENDPTIAGGLGAANPWARLAVLFGGPLMNIITGIFLFSLIFTSIGAPDYTKVLVVAVNKGSPAETAGLKVNDLIVSINATPVDSTEKLSNIVHQNLGQEIQITLQRGQEQVVVHATPREKS
ncbi:MAG TPA: M50 family metallopeptidase, partial [Anaerolineaceae bacterium]